MIPYVCLCQYSSGEGVYQSPFLGRRTFMVTLNCHTTGDCTPSAIQPKEGSIISLWLRVTTSPRQTPMAHCPVCSNPPLHFSTVGEWAEALMDQGRWRDFWRGDQFPSLFTQQGVVVATDGSAPSAADAEDPEAEDGRDDEVMEESNGVGGGGEGAQHAGAGLVFRRQDNRENVCFSVQIHKTSLLAAEGAAITWALNCLPPDQQVTILTDSANMMFLLESGCRHTLFKDRTRHPHEQMIDTCCKFLSRRLAPTHFVKIQAHQGHWLNEQADLLSAKGRDSENHPYDYEPNHPEELWFSDHHPTSEPGSIQLLAAPDMF